MRTCTVSSGDSKATLLSIPTETRTEILSYLLQTDLIINMGEREPDNPKQPQYPRLAKVRLAKVRRHRKMKLHTNILLTCKQICDEGSFVLYQRNTFFFDSVTAMEKWLVPITARWEGKHPSRYRHDIRKVEIAVGIVREPQGLARMVGGRASPQRLYVEELSDHQQLLFNHLVSAGLSGVRKLTLETFGWMASRKDSLHINSSLGNRVGESLIHLLRTSGVKAKELTVKGCPYEELVKELKKVVESGTEDTHALGKVACGGVTTS